MKVKNLFIEFHIDYMARQVHVLEKGRPIYHENLPNNMGEDFQKEMIEKNSLLIDTLDFEWVCYCQNGLILRFRERKLGLISKTDNSLYKPFLDALTI